MSEDQLPDVVGSGGYAREAQPVVLVGPLGPLNTTGEGEMRVTVAEQEENVGAALSSGTITVAGTTWKVFIDLDGGGWPHDPEGFAIHFSILSLAIDKSSNAKGSVALGVITRIDGTSADVTLFFGKSFANNASDTELNLFRNYSPSQLKTDVEAGEMTKWKTTAKLTNITAINTGITLDSADGPITPAVGDIVARYVLDSGTNMSAALQAFYHSQVVV